MLWVRRRRQASACPKARQTRSAGEVLPAEAAASTTKTSSHASAISAACECRRCAFCSSPISSQALVDGRSTGQREQSTREHFARVEPGTESSLGEDGIGRLRNEQEDCERDQAVCKVSVFSVCGVHRTRKS